MKAGTLNRRITIQDLHEVVDPIYGLQPAEWVDVKTVWAEVQDVLPSRSESVKQGIAMAANRTRIRFRYRSGITSAMRVVEQGGQKRTLQIIGGPAVLGNREGIEIMCEEYSTQGGT